MSDHEHKLPPATFEFLVLSMRVQAEIHLGLYPSPDGVEPSIDVARHTIDLLAALQAKTKGNLTVEEQRLLDNSLTELRFRFIQAVQPAASAPPASNG